METKNPYCETIGIDPPALCETVVGRRLNYRESMILALLERGGPMTLEELVARLGPIWGDAPPGRLATVLPRAWGGREPVYRDRRGRYGLNLHSRKLENFLVKAGLRPSEDDGPIRLPSLRLPDSSVPLESLEVQAALSEDRSPALSELEMAAAVLDAAGRPLTPDAVEDMLAFALRRGIDLEPETVRSWASDLVTITGDGLLALDRSHPSTRKIREEIRRLAAPTLLPELRVRRFRELREERDRSRAAGAREREAEAALLRRGILHCLPGPREPAVYGLLLVREREIRTAVAGETERLRRLVADLDVVAGLGVRETLEGLGLEPDRFVLRDLCPPQRNKRMRRSGENIHLTSSLLIEKTTGIENPLGDAALARADAAAGRTEALRDRVSEDLRSLFALYRFGALHRFVLVRWKGELNLLSVDWAEPGDLSYRQQVRAAAAGSRPLEAVVGRAPDWEDPWRRARRVLPKAVGPGGADIRDWDTGEYIYPIYVQALRLR